MASTGTVVRPEDIREWGQQLDEVARRIGSRFARSETRDRVRSYLVGLLGPVRRKNAWQLAEPIGAADPYGQQIAWAASSRCKTRSSCQGESVSTQSLARIDDRPILPLPGNDLRPKCNLLGVQDLMGRPDWDPDAVRDDLRAYVIESLGDPDAVLVLDETGSLKKGHHSAGVARQYTGTAGRIENCQVGVFLAYPSRHGTASLGRALYLPGEWTGDPGRCREAGIPEGTAFATKPGLARAMLERAFAAGVPAAWVTGDGVDGGDGALRRWLERERKPYVLAVRANQFVWAGFRQATVAALAQALPKRAWHTITIAAGSKGPRRYAWAWLPINSDLGPRWRRWLLVRRRLDDPGDLAYYLAAGPSRTTLTRLAKTAGARWSVEGAFEAAKPAVGLADSEVRSWTGWYRHVTPSLLAHAVLAAVRELADGPPKKS